MNSEPKGTLTLDGETYNVSDLSEQVLELTHVLDGVQKQIIGHRRKLLELNASERAITNDLKQILSKPPEGFK